MFEPACRGGSKRSLNISNPTPKWPRSPGEMVSAPARAADTQTHALTRTLGPTHTRRAPRPPPLSPSALGASDFISCFLDFNLPAGFPPAPGEPAHPGWSFPEFRVLGWAEQGRPASLLRPAGPRSPGHTIRPPQGRSRGQRPAVAAHARSLVLPARPTGPRSGPLSPGPLSPARPPALEKFTSCGWLNAERVGSSLQPLPTLWFPLG